MDLDLFGPSGKTSQGASTPPTTPSATCSADWLAPLDRLWAQIPVGPGSGRVLGFLRDQQGGVRGACSTLNFSEAANCTATARCPNAGSASSLSSVLERKGVPVPKRCFLSRAAKDGLLRRAERRRRRLPPMLELALKE